MKLKGLLCFVILLSTLAFKKAKKGYVYVDGKNIYSPQGEKLHLKGVNLGNWLLPEGYMFKLKNCDTPRKMDQAIRELTGNTATLNFWDAFLEAHITEADIEWLASTGINTIRLPFDYRLLTDDDFLGRNKHGYQYLDKAIEWCKKYDLYVLLDMHGAPGGQTGANIDNGDGFPWLMVDEGMQQKTADIWRDIAKRYAKNTTVIGYNLLNEPIAHYFAKDSITHHLEPLYKKITKSIRTVDENHIVFIGGALWETDFSIFSEPFDDKLVYTFHKYWMPAVQEEIQTYINFREKYNVPIFMGESGENEDEWIDKFRALLDKNDIHWTFWSYKKMANTRSPMTFDKPEGFDDFIQYADANRSTFKNIRALKDTVEGISPSEITAILQQYVENSKFENCYPNKGYCKGLLLEIGE